jgi:hypothetical protein
MITSIEPVMRTGRADHTTSAGPASDDPLIERFLPRYHLRQVDRVAVAAGLEPAWTAVRGMDLYAIPWVRALFGLRLLPEIALKRLRGKDARFPKTSTIDDIGKADTGFRILGQEPGREVVVGAIGTFWQARIAFQGLDAAEFASFRAPGCGKLAWALRVDPRTQDTSWVSLDLRVTATDEASWRRFKRYWRLIGPFSHAMRRGALAALRRQLGPVRGDEDVRFPGDELLPHARVQQSHAITIEAPRDEIWPWLLQMGGQRAGWYSLDRLDNAGIPSATRIIPDLQELHVGEIIPARPKGPGGFAVLALDKPHALVLGSPLLLTNPPAFARTDVPYRSTWAFVLEPIGPSATRLIARVRAEFTPSLKMAVMGPWLIGLHQVMQRAQLRNLKRRVEAAHVASPASGR